MQNKEPKIAKDSRYALVMAVARRARQLMQLSVTKGINPIDASLVKTGAYKPVKLALEEITQGKLGYKKQDKAASTQAKKISNPATDESSLAVTEETSDVASQ